MARKGRAKEHEKENHERWLITYADMITLLLALFVVLYATSKADPVRFEQVAGSIQRAFNVPVLKHAQPSGAIALGNLGNAFVGLTGIGATIGPDIVSYAARQQLGDEISVTASRDAIVITLAGALPFVSGSAELRPEARAALEFVAGTLRSLPERNPIRVEGHTDSTPPNTGRFPTNWDLSAARAGSTARLLEELGVEADRIIAVGYADTRPVAGNDTPEGRTRNRRVEIWILNPEPIGPTAVAPSPAGR